MRIILSKEIPYEVYRLAKSLTGLKLHVTMEKAWEEGWDSQYYIAPISFSVPQNVEFFLSAKPIFEALGYSITIEEKLIKQQPIG